MSRVRRRSWPTRLIVVVLLVLAAACDNPFGLGDDDERDRLERNRDIWELLGPASYDLTVRAVCFCGYIDPVRVEVRDGVKVAVVPTTELPFPLSLDYFPSVPELFEIVDEAIERDAHRLEVRYGELGVPARIEIDYAEHVADDEITWDVLALERR